MILIKNYLFHVHINYQSYFSFSRKFSLIFNSNTTCNYPVLIGQIPSFCNVHLEVTNEKVKEHKLPRKRKSGILFTFCL